MWDNLQANVAGYDQVKLFQYGVGEPGERSLFFTPGRRSYDLVKIDVGGSEFDVLVCKESQPDSPFNLLVEIVSKTPSVTPG